MDNEKIPIHYYHSFKVTILVVVGGGGEISKFYAIISHEPTTVISFYPSFHFFFHHHLHAFIHKTYFVWVRLLDSLTVHSTNLNRYGRSCYTIQTRHDNPARIVSRSLPNLLVGRLAGLFSEAPGI
jgi:hypothetical protein